MYMCVCVCTLKVGPVWSRHQETRPLVVESIARTSEGKLLFILPVLRETRRQPPLSSIRVLMSAQLTLQVNHKITVHGADANIHCTLTFMRAAKIVWQMDVYSLFSGWTPLHEACNHGYVDIVALLLDSGAYINASGMGGDTPLHDAVVNNHIEVSSYEWWCVPTPAGRHVSGRLEGVVMMKVDQALANGKRNMHISACFEPTWLSS